MHLGTILSITGWIIIGLFMAALCAVYLIAFTNLRIRFRIKPRYMINPFAFTHVAWVAVVVGVLLIVLGGNLSPD